MGNLSSRAGLFVLALTIAVTPLVLVEALLLPSPAPVYGVAFSQDGVTLATASSTIDGPVIGNGVEEIRVYDARSGQEHVESRRAFSQRSLTLAVRDGIIRAGTPDAPLTIRDLTRLPLRMIFNGAPSSGPALFSPDSRLLVTLAVVGAEPYSERGPLHLWDVNDGALRGVLGSGDAVQALALSADGRTLAAVAARQATWDSLGPTPNAQSLKSAGARLVVWDFNTGRERAAPAPELACLAPVALSPRGDVIAAASAGGVLGVVRLADGRPLGNIPVLAAESVTFSSDGQRLAVGGGDTVEVWDLVTMRMLRRYNGHAQQWFTALKRRFNALLSDSYGDGVAVRISAIAFSPDERLVASADSNGVVRLWDVATGRDVLTLPHRYPRVHWLGDPLYALSCIWALAWTSAGVLKLATRARLVRKSGKDESGKNGTCTAPGA